MRLPDAVPGSLPGPWAGGRVSSRIRCVLAPNPGPMALDGTNTYLLSEPGSGVAVVVDPGPDDDVHLGAVLDDLAAHDQRGALVLLTHGHLDHSAGARRLAERLGCAVRAVDPGHRWGADGLDDGAAIRVGGLEIQVVATPGHTADSVCLLLESDDALLTGDTVLGRGTTVVAHPDGRLRDYLGSLDRLEAVAQLSPSMRLMPGHGPAGAPVRDVVTAYRVHRAARLRQVQACVRAGASDVPSIVADVYADVDRGLWPAAALSVRAQVDYLTETGAVTEQDGRLAVSGRDA
jgi:glyoxylase-like metal-dependent hydrolase (beta-lactamase superfamily II)